MSNFYAMDKSVLKQFKMLNNIFNRVKKTSIEWKNVKKLFSKSPIFLMIYVFLRLYSSLF